MIELTVNGQHHSLDIEHETPLLWVIRDEIGLTGTKYGCGIAQCGACTVHASDADIDASLTNICRCGTYGRIRKAIHVAVRNAGGGRG